MEKFVAYSAIRIYRQIGINLEDRLPAKVINHLGWRLAMMDSRERETPGAAFPDGLIRFRPCWFRYESRCRWFVMVSMVNDMLTGASTHLWRGTRRPGVYLQVFETLKEYERWHLAQKV